MILWWCWQWVPLIVVHLSHHYSLLLFSPYPIIQGTAQTYRLCISDQYHGAMKKNEKHCYSLQSLKAQRGTIFSSKLSGFHCTYLSQTWRNQMQFETFGIYFSAKQEAELIDFYFCWNEKAEDFPAYSYQMACSIAYTFAPCCGSPPTWSPQRWREKNKTYLPIYMVIKAGERGNVSLPTSSYCSTTPNCAILSDSGKIWFLKYKCREYYIEKTTWMDIWWLMT